MAASELARRTLTNLYNERPARLANAHAALDAAVFAAYGWPPDLADEQILARLLALNLEREPTPQSVDTPGEDGTGEDRASSPMASRSGLAEVRCDDDERPAALACGLPA